MRRKARFYFLLTAVFVVSLAFMPAPALAQHGHGPGPGHWGGGHVYVRAGFGGYWGYPYWGWGPYWGAAYWGWGGPWYGYGYPWGYYPGPPDDSASVKLEVTPKDAQVYVDGNYLGVVDDFDGMFQKLHVPPGNRELVLYKPGFKTVKQTIRLGRGQDVKIHYALEPLAAGETADPPPPPPKREEPQDPDAGPAVPDCAAIADSASAGRAGTAVNGHRGPGLRRARLPRAAGRRRNPDRRRTVAGPRGRGSARRPGGGRYASHRDSEGRLQAVLDRGHRAAGRHDAAQCQPPAQRRIGGPP